MSRDFNLDGKVPPWGRNAAEYESFFSLDDIAVSARVLDCGSGPASFAAEWSAQGRFAVAADPISDELSLDLHIASLREMLRVGREVRVFPLLDMQGERSKHLEHAMRDLETIARVELVRVPFEFRRGDSFMLRLRTT